MGGIVPFKAVIRLTQIVCQQGASQPLQHHIVLTVGGRDDQNLRSQATEDHWANLPVMTIGKEASTGTLQNGAIAVTHGTPEEDTCA